MVVQTRKSHTKKPTKSSAKHAGKTYCVACHDWTSTKNVEYVTVQGKGDRKAETGTCSVCGNQKYTFAK